MAWWEVVQSSWEPESTVFVYCRERTCPNQRGPRSLTQSAWAMSIAQVKVQYLK